MYYNEIKGVKKSTQKYASGLILGPAYTYNIQPWPNWSGHLGRCARKLCANYVTFAFPTWADVLENCTQITLRLVFRPEFRVVA